MLYDTIKFWIRMTLLLFCRKITFSNRDILKQRGPFLLTLNHPNSFFDAILIGSHFKEPVYFLTRGDAFRNPLVKKILSVLKMIPIHRLTEGREHLALNDATFERCQEILLHDGIVLIFAEGLCRHQWQLRNLKKGSARIAMNAWSHQSISERFRVQPVSLNYDSFSHFGKRIVIHFGEPILKKDLNEQLTEGERLRQFNRLLSKKLVEGMIEEKNTSGVVSFLIINHSAFHGPVDQLIYRLKTKQENIIRQSLSPRYFQKTFLVANNSRQLWACLIIVLLLAPFAWIGWLLNAPLFFPLRSFVKKKTRRTVFYDSVLFGGLLLIYPLYWLLTNFVGWFFSNNLYVHLVLFAMPLFAWLLLIWKDNLERVIHFVILSEKERRELVYIFS